MCNIGFFELFIFVTVPFDNSCIIANSAKRRRSCIISIDVGALNLSIDVGPLYSSIDVGALYSSIDVEAT